jgi:hypothetical protein
MFRCDDMSLPLMDPSCGLVPPNCAMGRYGAIGRYFRICFGEVVPPTLVDMLILMADRLSICINVGPLGNHPNSRSSS